VINKRNLIFTGRKISEKREKERRMREKEMEEEREMREKGKCVFLF
jgi:hypothetical protein